jgi:RNA polymerase primary sigma factor
LIHPTQSAYITRITRHPILSRENELTLIHQAQAGNKRAEQLLIRSNLRFVVQTALKFHGRGLELDELITEGSIGLQSAVHKFDPLSGYRFTSYGVWWIRAHIGRAIEEKARLIRIGGNQSRNVARYRGLPLEQCLGGDRYPRTVPREGKKALPLESYAKEAAEALAPFSIDAPLTPDEGEGYAAFLASPDPSPEDWTATQTNADYLRRLLHHLTTKERRILSLSYGLESGEPLDLAVIGRQFGLSRERVRQIKMMAIRRLQKIQRQK